MHDRNRNHKTTSEIGQSPFLAVNDSLQDLRAHRRASILESFAAYSKMFGSLC